MFVHFKINFLENQSAVSHLWTAFKIDSELFTGGNLPKETNEQPTTISQSKNGPEASSGTFMAGPI